MKSSFLIKFFKFFGFTECEIWGHFIYNLPLPEWEKDGSNFCCSVCGMRFKDLPDKWR
jgi:hypothetical protein